MAVPELLSSTALVRGEGRLQGDRVDYRLPTTGGSGRTHALFPLLCGAVHGPRREHAIIISLPLRCPEVGTFFFITPWYNGRDLKRLYLKSH